MKTLFQYVSTYKKAAWIAILLMGVELVVELSQPLIMEHIIDEGIQTGNTNLVVIWTGVLLITTLLAFAAGIMSSYYAAETGQGAGHDLRRDLYENIQNFTMSQLQSFSASSLITRLTNDVTQIQSLIFTSLRIMLRAPLFIVGGIVMSFFVHPGMAFILLASIPFLFVIMFWLMVKGLKLFRSVQVKLDHVNTIIRENLAGIRLIKAFNRGDHEDKRFRSVNASLAEDNKKALWLMEATLPAMMLGVNTAIILILWAGFIEVNNGGAEAGEVVAIINYATRMMASFGVFSFLLMTFTRGRASATRIETVLNEKGEEKQEADNGLEKELFGEIEFQHVSFYFPGKGTKTLQNISFHIKPGETIGILGETGSGKSTLIQLIPRLLNQTEGRIKFDGVNIEEISRPSLRTQIGLVPQEAHLFSGSVMENLQWGSGAASEEQIFQACKDAHIHDYIESLPDGYDTIIGQRAVNLSGGQKQRLSLARALVRNPKILLLDDSTSALDAHTEAGVLAALRKRRATVLLITQKISSVQQADSILMLQQGEITANGTHEQLMQRSPYYQELLASQTEKGGVLDAANWK